VPAAGRAADPSAGSTTGVDGTWTVDPSIGSFSDFTNSFVGYRVQEELAGIGANTAVGRTPDVSGSMTIAGTAVSAATIEADLTTLQSDDGNRDRQLGRQGIQTDQFPTASFTITEPIELGSTGRGQEIEVTAKSQLTLHGQTRDVEVPMKARLSGDVIAVSGSIPSPSRTTACEAGVVQGPLGRRSSHHGIPGLLQPRLSSASRRSMKTAWASLMRTRASSGANQATRSISA
jgi:polyisoprenoid-binding protein YceI